MRAQLQLMKAPSPCGTIMGSLLSEAVNGGYEASDCRSFTASSDALQVVYKVYKTCIERLLQTSPSEKALLEDKKETARGTWCVNSTTEGKQRQRNDQRGCKKWITNTKKKSYCE